MKKKKFLLVNAVNKIGSTGRSCSEMSEWLQKNGNQCLIVHSTGPQTSDSIKFSSVIESKIHALLARLTGFQGYFSFFSTLKLITIIKEYEPDIVILRNVHGNFLNIITLLKYLGSENIPVALFLDDCWFYTGKCTHYTLQGCYKWKAYCGDCPKLNNDIPSLFFDKTANMIIDKERAFNSIGKLGVFGVSKWISNEARSSILKNATFIECLYNWIDLALFRHVENLNLRLQLAIEDKFVILGVASQWNDKKGLDIFVELSKEIDDDEIIILVGNNSVKSIPGKLLIIQATNDVNELVNYYSIADVFMQLSLEESFGKVVAESMACGTPVITINSTANAELIDEDTGILLPTRRLDLLKEAIDVIKKNGKYKYSRSCRSFVEDNFDKEKIMQKFMSQVNLLIDRGIS